LIKGILRNNAPKQYSSEVRDFACTLHFYSARAYDFVKKLFQLPSVSTLRSWTSNVKALPGFTREALTFLKAQCDADNNNFKVASLIIDSMSIKEHVEYDSSLNKTIGYVDLGCFSAEDTEELAKEALVVMLVGLRGHWKLPVAYYFVCGVTASLQAGIIREIIVQCHSFGLRIVSVTCDGTNHNLKTVNILGATLLSAHNEPTMQPFFPHPSDAKLSVGVFLDPCHMFKLIRNLLHKYQILKWPGHGMIKWEYIKQLNKLQESHKLLLANKVS
jgi:hypothetical protein